MSSLCLTPSLPAWGQVSGPAPSEVRIDEIIVTAQRRSESLQDVPISVSAFSQDTLEDLRIETLSELATITPNLTFAESADIKASSTSLRGVSTSFATAGADPAVGYYLDDVFLGNAVSASLDLFDIDRIEVLRGPQGTLFGRNTVGGVINIATAAPSDVLEGTVATEYGSYGRVRSRARVTGPLNASKTLRYSVSGLYEERDGYFENAFDGSDHGSIEQFGLRGRVDYDVSDRTMASLSADFRKYKQIGRAAETLRYNLSPTALLTAVQPIFGYQFNSDPFDYVVYVNNEGEQVLENWGVSLRIDSELDAFDIISVTAFRDTNYEDSGDADFTELDWLSDGDPEDTERFSQELRLENYRGDRLGWTAGLYYYTQDSDGQSLLENGPDVARALEFANGLPGGTLNALTAAPYGAVARTEVESLAAFASLTITLTQNVDVTVGGRYTYETKSIEYAQSDILLTVLGINGIGGNVAFSGDEDFSAFTPSVNIRYQPVEDATLYATASRGFKSGGFNDGLGAVGALAFDPETIWNYEAGAKLTLLEGRASLNVAVFHMDWSDIQIRNDNPATPAVFDPIITNAAGADSTGLEIETRVKPFSGLEVGGSYAVLDAHYAEGTLADGTPLGRLPFAPDVSANLFAQYTASLSPRFDLSVQGVATIVGDRLVNVNETVPDAEQDGYQLFDARVTLSDTVGGWALSAFGKNLGDEVYITRLVDNLGNPFVAQQNISLNAPRTYGVELRYDF
ncbi:MAG: TonB-dependent receptor [Jannaschia sp.]